jgi:ribonuclease-3
VSRPAASANDLAALGARLGHVFADPELLLRAVTHRSFGAQHNERLEFLGDSVLSLSIAAVLYDRFPGLREGELTRLRAGLVRRETLARLARDLELGSYLQLGSGELKSGGYDRDTILADAFEAVLGAIYLDGGFEAARGVIAMLFAPLLAAVNPRTVRKDPKTALQEYLQGRSLGLPEYRIRSLAGQDHAQRFVVECVIPGHDPVTGEGGSRRKAEQQAAARVLEQLAARA